MLEGSIRDHARWTPRAPAVITPTHVMSYAQFDADIDRLGAAFRDLGIGPDSGVVALQIDLPYLHYAAICALARIGAISAPGHDGAADLRITDSDDARPHQPTLCIGGEALGAILAAEPRPLPVLKPDPESLARVMLTSGTTLRPRRIGLSWRRLEAVNHTTLRTYGAGRLGTWIPLPGIDSMMGYGFAMAAWSTGSALTSIPDVAQLPKWLESLAPGMLGATPTQLSSLLEALPAGFTPRPAWRIFSGGSMLPTALARETCLRITPDLIINYGSTEASINALCRVDHQAPLGTVGYTPHGATVEVLAPEGESGEIRIRSSRMTLGYLDDPAATAERFRDGWFHPGDVGRRLPDGRLVLEGRVDDRMILADVGKFMPALLEDAALACPGVLDAAAFAVPNAAGLDDCWLAIVSDVGFDRESLATHLAAYRGLPANRFAWIDEIPRNAMGKVDRNKLREALLAALDQGRA
jgi:acyl-CoA synthetase (AMP-forming)/AMP-acid ligase II